MISKYNEEEYAKEIEKIGFLTKYHNYELILLVKYWKHCGIKPKERKEKIYDFCNKYIENFNEIKYFKMINIVLNRGSKNDNPLIVINKISITDSEIEYINKLDLEYDYKKILFSLLVHMKLKREICKIRYNEDLKFNYISGNQNTYNEIMAVSKLSNKSLKINTIINYLEQLNYIDVRTKGKLNLLFIYKINQSDKIVFNITTFDNIGYYFDWYNGDQKIIRCESCGQLIKKTSNRKKYCKDCWKEKQREWQRNSMKKQRNVKF